MYCKEDPLKIMQEFLFLLFTLFFSTHELSSTVAYLFSSPHPHHSRVILSSLASPHLTQHVSHQGGFDPKRRNYFTTKDATTSYYRYHQVLFSILHALPSVVRGLAYM
jgi:hypothetical protein